MFSRKKRELMKTPSISKKSRAGSPIPQTLPVSAGGATGTEGRVRPEGHEEEEEGAEEGPPGPGWGDFAPEEGDGAAAEGPDVGRVGERGWGAANWGGPAVVAVTMGLRGQRDPWTAWGAAAGAGGDAGLGQRLGPAVYLFTQQQPNGAGGGGERKRLASAGQRAAGVPPHPWHCPPRACAAPQPCGTCPWGPERRGHRASGAHPWLLSEGGPVPTSPRPPPSPRCRSPHGEGPMGGRSLRARGLAGRRDARPGVREAQLQPLRGRAPQDG